MEKSKLETYEVQKGRSVDEEYKDIKKNLGEENKDVFNKFKEDQIKQGRKNFQLENENRELNEENERMSKDLEEINYLYERKLNDYRKLAIDSVTGLLRREFLYKDVNKYINQKIQLSGQESEDEIINRLISLAALTEDKSVLVSDVSFLSLANKAGHAVGDKLLKKIAEKIVEQELKVFRHGGDEMTALLDNPESSIPKLVEEIRDKVRELNNLDSLSSYELEPNIDIGTASLQETALAYNEIVKRAKAEGVDLLKNQQTYFENLWIEIADKRSFINKGKIRIPLLVQKYRDQQENDDDSYTEIIDCLRKGGYDISDKEVESFCNTAESEEDIAGFIYRKETEKIEKEKGLDKIKAEVVLKYAWENKE